MRSPLQTLPGVGPSIARDLADLGYEDPDDPALSKWWNWKDRPAD